jgi:hypothetical protein
MVCPGEINLWKVAVIGTTTYVKGSDIECTNTGWEIQDFQHNLW